MEENKTGLYAPEQDTNTSMYSTGESHVNAIKMGINAGDRIYIRNVEYFVVSIISTGTGEAVIYKITDASEKSYALKLYYEFQFNDDEPNGIALQRIQSLNDADILKLYEFGIGAEKYLGKYCYEISELALGGNLLQVENFREKYTPEFVLEDIIPQIYLAITKLHEYKIYHCDLKPQNILYLDAAQTDLVIGDYGSAKAYDMQSEKELRRSKVVKGTEAYLAPEQARGITSEKNDYYSFGMILLHLLYPEQLCEDASFSQINREKFTSIVEKQYNSEPIICFNTKYPRLNQLIGGLTMAYHYNRWGEKEVAAWLDGENPNVPYTAEANISDESSLKIGNTVIHNDKEIADFIENNNNFFEDLIENEKNYSALKTWLIQSKDIPYKNTFVSLVVYYRDLGRKYLREAIIRFIRPEKPIIIKGEVFEFWKLSDIQTFNKSIEKFEELFKSLPDGEEKRFYSFQQEFVLRQLTIYGNNLPIEVIKAWLEIKYRQLGVNYDFPEKLITLCTHNKKPEPKSSINIVSTQNQSKQKPSKNILQTENKTVKESEFDKFNSHINIIESEGNGIRFYGHYSTEAANNYMQAWYCYFFFKINESGNFKKHDVLNQIKNILTDKALDFNEITNYAIYTHDLNASKMQISHAAFTTKDWLNQAVWGYVDVKKIMAFYFENGSTTPIDASNLDLIKGSKMLLTLYVVYPLKHQLKSTHKVSENKLVTIQPEKVQAFKTHAISNNNSSSIHSSETNKFKIEQYFTAGEYKRVSNIVDESVSVPHQYIKEFNLELKRCSVKEAMLSYYLFLKYSRDDGVHEISPEFSPEKYQENIKLLVSEGKITESKIDIEEKRKFVENEFIVTKTKCEDWCKQYQCKNYWIAKKNYSLKNGKTVDIATIYNNEIYSVFDCVSPRNVSASFKKLLSIYNQYASIRSFGIYNYETRTWYLFGDYYYEYHGTYYLEMKNKKI